MEPVHTWSTANIKGAAARRFWSGRLCEAVFELDLTIDSAEEDLDASIQQYDFGDFRMSLIKQNFSQRLSRTLDKVRRARSAQFEMVMLTSGTARITTCGRVEEARPGDTFLVDSRIPYGLQTSPCCSSFSFHIPTHYIDQVIEHPADLCGKPVRGGSCWGRVLQDLAESTYRDAQVEGPSSRPDARQLVQIFSFAREAGVGDKRDLRNPFARAQALLQKHAFDTDLTAEGFAALLKVSTRYLHKLYAQNGTTYGKELMRIRLNAAADMLRDQRTNALPIGEIAWRVGFSDESHFYRRFKSEFDQSPGAFRRVHT